MQLLVVGGSGFVGSQVVPLLAHHHGIRVFDRVPPPYEVGQEHVQGDLRDFTALAAAMDGVDAVVFMAMGPGPAAGWGSPESARAHLDVAVTGLYLTLRAAHEHGVGHAVYTSSMSVYQFPRPGTDRETSRYPDESVPPDATDFYGLAKRLGEQVCANAHTAWGMDVVALRLCFPTPPDRWPPEGDSVRATIATSGRDVARAIRAALQRRGHGFEPFAISGDAAGRIVPLDRARETLGWEPLDPTDAPVAS